MKVRAEAAVLLLAGIGHCLVASHARAEPAPVRVTYRAIEGCPSEEEFLERVRSRTLRASFAATGDLARSFDVALEVTEEKVLSEMTDSEDIKEPIPRRSNILVSCKLVVKHPEGPIFLQIRILFEDELRKGRPAEPDEFLAVL